MWIEGKDGRPNRPCMHVEARESLVDRNPSESLVWLTGNKSRLARALWIEILLFGLSSPPLLVEARESLVDRNSPITGTIFTVCCQGSREPCGLKCRRPFPEGRQLCRGSREPCGFKFYRWNILFYRPCK